MRELTRHLWYFLCRYVLIIIPDRYFVQLTAFITFKRLGFKFRKFDLINPVSFNEKLTYLKINKSHSDHSMYVDKYKVREYIKEIIGEEYLVPLINVFYSVHEIEWDTLPPSFVLKANHGSGWNVICTNKDLLDIGKTKRQFNKWLKYNAFYLTREYQYKPIRPAIVCEQLLGYNIYDYKFFCFNGEPKIVQIDVDRFTNHRRVFFNMDWERQNFSIRYPASEKVIDKPVKLKEMQEICRKLSSPFRFVRVDLYLHNSKVYFGELTFTPGGGNEPFNPVEADYIFGELLVI